MSTMLYGAGILAEIAEAYARATWLSREETAKILADWSACNAQAFKQAYGHLPSHGSREPVTVEEILAALPDRTKPVSVNAASMAALMEHNLGDSAPEGVLKSCRRFANALGGKVSS